LIGQKSYSEQGIIEHVNNIKEAQKRFNRQARGIQAKSIEDIKDMVRTQIAVAGRDAQLKAQLYNSLTALLSMLLHDSMRSKW
jgi:hypothetical protein